MLYDKLTHGTVVQTFNDQGDCIGQQFEAGDQVDYKTTEDGLDINQEDMPLGGREYFPFDMVQPDINKIENDKCIICQEKDHDQCPLVAEGLCTCCDNTRQSMRDQGIS